MTKTQKIWLWIFGLMFVVPEILFITTPALIMSIAGKSFSEISSFVINYSSFLKYPLLLLLIVVVEWIGVFGLFVLSIKINKKLLAILFGVILLWLFFIFVIVYVTGFSMSF